MRAAPTPSRGGGERLVKGAGEGVFDRTEQRAVRIVHVPRAAVVRGEDELEPFVFVRDAFLPIAVEPSEELHRTLYVVGRIE